MSVFARSDKHTQCGYIKNSICFAEHSIAGFQTFRTLNLFVPYPGISYPIGISASLTLNPILIPTLTPNSDT